MGYYITPETVIVVGSVLPGLAAMAVISRFYVRSRNVAKYGLDDWFILASLMFTIACGVSLIVGSALGGLAHPKPASDGPGGFLTAKNRALVITMKVDWIVMLLQCFAFGFAKLSVVYFYRRIFCNPATYRSVFDIITLITIGFLFVWMITFFLLILLECRGHWWAQWGTLLELMTYCLDDPKIQLGFAYTDVIVDVWILSLPIPQIWKLQMKTRRKLGLCAVFFMGALAIAAGAVRLVIFIEQLTHAYEDPDGIRLLTTRLYWSVIEMGLCIIAACLPALKPLFRFLPTESLWCSLRSFFSSRSMVTSKVELSNMPNRQSHKRSSQDLQKSLV